MRELETELNEWSSSMTVEEIEASIKVRIQPNGHVPPRLATAACTLSQST